MTVPIHHDLEVQLTQERYALSSLLEFAHTLTPDLGPRGIMRSVLRTVMGKSLIKEAIAYLGTANGEHYELVARAGFDHLAFSEVLDRNGLARLIDDISEPFTIVPLMTADGAGYLGLLALGPSINPKLSGDSEATYLASLAALTSIALTNAWLFEREKERERLESELRLARDIQQSLLPQQLPQIAGVEFAAISRPSEWVGGDYYDVIQLDDNRVLLAIADVVGKGVTAALTMSNLQAALRALVMMLREGHLTLLDVVKELNRLMCESTAPERFITAAFGVIDIRHHTLETVVCGHPNPIIISPEHQPVIAESTGIPLGIIPTFPYESRSYHLSQGSLLVLYTDGLSEAFYGEALLGERGTVQLALKASQQHGDLQQILQEMGRSEQISIEDDITVLAVRINR